MKRISIFFNFFTKNKYVIVTIIIISLIGSLFGIFSFLKSCGSNIEGTTHINLILNQEDEPNNKLQFSADCDYIHNSKDFNKMLKDGSISFVFKMKSKEMTNDQYIIDLVDYFGNSFFSFYVKNKQIMNISLHDTKNREHLLIFTYPKLIYEFVHVIVTWSTFGEINLFINGSQVNTIILDNDVDFSLYVKDYYFGCKHDITKCFAGAMSSVKIWSRKLDDNEIHQVFENEKR